MEKDLHLKNENHEHGKRRNMNYVKHFGLAPADRIIEPLFQTGFSKHHAIYLGINSLGIELVAENHKVKGVQIITASEYFSSVKRIDRIEKFDGNYIDRKAAVQRALELAGKRYDLINYNCEHFANEVLTGKAKSKQVEIVFAGMLAVFLIGILSTE